MKQCIIILALFVSVHGLAQRNQESSVELIAGAGTTHFFGDIGGYSRGKNLLGFKDITRYNTGLNLNGAARYRFNKAFSARLNFSGGIFNVSDKIGSKTERGFEASTGFFETFIAGEYFLLTNKIYNRAYGGKKIKNGYYPFWSYFDAYVYAGFGSLFFDVDPNKALILKRTGRDSQDFIIPAGAGITRKLEGSSKIGIEFGGRYIFADLADGYSFPGSSNDIYYFADIIWTWSVPR
ncbi:MAG TPA: hypothetical protein VK213_05675 [Bacteroidales bacterium]|nr:hypothetical protein [Bacteroidales bacterium]